MSKFIKSISLTLAVIGMLVVVMACEKDTDDKPITTSPTTTTEEITTLITSADDGFGPLIPLVTDKQ